MPDLNTEAQKYGGSRRIIDSELTYKVIRATVEVRKILGVQRLLKNVDQTAFKPYTRL